MSSVSYEKAVRIYEQVRSAVHARVQQGPLGEGVRLAPLSPKAIEAWRTTWERRHVAGTPGGWRWPDIRFKFSRKVRSFDLSIWSGNTLCGMSAGRISAQRPNGTCLAVDVYFIEGAPWEHALKGRIAPLALDAAGLFGAALRADCVRIIDPDPGLDWLYAGLKFLPVKDVDDKTAYFKRSLP